MTREKLVFVVAMLLFALMIPVTTAKLSSDEALTILKQGVLLGTFVTVRK